MKEERDQVRMRQGEVWKDKADRGVARGQVFSREVRYCYDL